MADEAKERSQKKYGEKQVWEQTGGEKEEL